MVDPDMGTWAYAYDLSGNLISQTDGDNVTLTFAYDELNRQTVKTYPDSSTATFEYDAGTNGVGLLYKKTNANAVYEYETYDQVGRLLAEKRKK
jgi:YD repeat-containing protein